MLGAIIGDIVGSRFEFNNHRSKEFGLFGNDGLRRRACCFTDDSVMTVAVADALLSVKDTSNDEAVTKAFILKMHEYGRRYPGAGYGGMFFDWLFEGEDKPYNSFGNGSAMRASPIRYAGGNSRGRACVSCWTLLDQTAKTYGCSGVVQTVFILLHRRRMRRRRGRNRAVESVKIFMCSELSAS